MYQKTSAFQTRDCSAHILKKEIEGINESVIKVTELLIWFWYYFPPHWLNSTLCSTCNLKSISSMLLEIHMYIHTYPVSYYNKTSFSLLSAVLSNAIRNTIVALSLLLMLHPVPALQLLKRNWYQHIFWKSLKTS